MINSKKCLYAALAFVFVALMTVSCGKDDVAPVVPDNNDTTDVPTEPNYLIIGEDTVNVTGVTRTYNADYGMHTTVVELDNGCNFTIDCMIIPDGDFKFLRLNEFYSNPDSVLGAYVVGNTNNYLSQGDYSAHYAFDNVVMNFEGWTENRLYVKAHYCGKVTDKSTPMGNGTFKFAGNNYRTSLVYGIKRANENLHTVTLTSNNMDFAITVKSKENFLSNKNYTISSNQNDIDDGNGLGLTIVARDENGAAINATAVSGNFIYSVNYNSTVTININGTTENGGNFTLLYEGDFTLIQFLN